MRWQETVKFLYVETAIKCLASCKWQSVLICVMRPRRPHNVLKFGTSSVCWMLFLRTYWLFMWQECCVNIIDSGPSVCHAKSSVAGKVLHKKPVFWDLANFSIGKTVFWLNFLVPLHFWNQYEKTDFFYTSFAISEETKFSCLRRDNGYLRT